MHELVHRHQFDRGDTEVDEVVDDHRMREARIRAAKLFRHTGMRRRHALDVGLVDHGVVVWVFRCAVGSPVEERVDHHRRHRVAERVVSGQSRRRDVPPGLRCELGVVLGLDVVVRVDDLDGILRFLGGRARRARRCRKRTGTGLRRTRRRTPCRRGRGGACWGRSGAPPRDPRGRGSGTRTADRERRSAGTRATRSRRPRRGARVSPCRPSRSGTGRRPRRPRRTRRSSSRPPRRRWRPVGSAAGPHGNGRGAGRLACFHIENTSPRSRRSQLDESGLSARGWSSVRQQPFRL